MPSNNFNEGKPRPSLLLQDAPNAVREILKVFEEGAQKYGRGNWKESIGVEGEEDKFYRDNLDSLQRHVFGAYQGEAFDPDGGNLHLAKIAVRAIYAIEYLLGGANSKTC